MLMTQLTGVFGILTVLKGDFLTAVGGEGKATDAIHTNAIQPGAWEKFTLEQKADGTVCVKTYSNYYLTVAPVGSRSGIKTALDINKASSWRLWVSV
jgi:hypothetical protein